MTPRWTAIFVSGGLLLAAACGDATRPDALGGFELNHAKWLDKGPASYAYEFRRSCFCLPAAVEPVRITVANGQVQGVVSVTTGDPIAPTDVDRFFRITIDSLFGRLAAAIREGADDIDVTYDAVLGYPRQIYIDYDFGFADDELGLSASVVVSP